MKGLDSLHVLQLGPVWMLSAVSGSSTSFAPLDRDVFWRVVHSVARARGPYGQQVSAEHEQLLLLLAELLELRSPSQALG